MISQNSKATNWCRLFYDTNHCSASIAVLYL